MLKSDVLSQLKQLKKDIREASNQNSGLVRGSLGRFGFVVLNDGKECFLNPEEMQKVFPGDKILAEINQDDKGRHVATVVKVQDSTLNYFVGRYLIRGKGHFAVPDLDGLNRWIFIPPKKRKQAKEGDYILCKVMQHPFRDGKPQAEVVRIIGNPEKPGLPTEYALAKYNLGGKTPDRITDDKIKKHINQQIASRKDLRQVNFITIDADSTLDMDDALSVERSANGWTVKVAIADPAEFIQADSDADKYARRLGSSYYFPDRVLSMLHSKLANEYCSLQPEQDRLAIVCTLYIDDDGCVTASDFVEAVINSKAKLSYEYVCKLLVDENTEQTNDDNGHSLQSQLKCLQEMTNALHNRRNKEALITPDKPEFKLMLDANKKVENIVPRLNTPAHRLIEETMIATNRAAAAFLREKTNEALYSAHSGFRPERLEQLKTVASEQCAGFDTNLLESWNGLKCLLNELSNEPCELPLQAIASRMLTRGTLSKTPAPHAGMGLPEYTTFTSPIRKYVDLTVHRIIKATLRQKPAYQLSKRALERLQEALRNGRNAVNETEHWLKCEYAQNLIGQSFSGRIQHTNGSGFQVRLDDSGIDGVVNLGSVNEKFKFDGTRFQHIGENTKFCLEQAVKVKISAVDMDKKQIAMELDS